MIAFVFVLFFTKKKEHRTENLTANKSAETHSQSAKSTVIACVPVLASAPVFKHLLPPTPPPLSSL